MPHDDLRDHFHYGMWPGGGVETVSGAGSTLLYTEALRPQLSSLLRSLKTKVLVDLGCGDLNWIRHLDLADILYVGCDIVEEVIAVDRSKTRADRNVRLEVLDITRDSLPAADLYLCRDVILHFPFTVVADFFDNLLRSEFDHILVSTHTNDINRDIARPGLSRMVNLTKAPFGFPAGDGGRLADWIAGYPERYLELYSAEAFKAAAREAIPALRGNGGR